MKLEGNIRMNGYCLILIFMFIIFVIINFAIQTKLIFKENGGDKNLPMLLTCSEN